MPDTTSYRATAQPFVADRDSMSMDSGHTIDWDNVAEDYRETPGQTVTLGANVAADATSMTVVALTRALPAGTLLHFGEAGENVRVATSAAVGATTVAVDGDHGAIESGDSAVVAGSGYKRIPAGTPMGTLLSGNDSMSPRVVTTNPAVGLLATEAHENSRSDSRSGYGLFLGGVVYENLLPGATGTPRVIASAIKTELQTAGVGTGFSFKQYVDSSAS